MLTKQLGTYGGAHPTLLGEESLVRLNPKARLFVTIFCVATLSLCPTLVSPDGKTKRIDCDAHAGPCVAYLEATLVSLEMSPKPVKAMQELTFTLGIGGEQPAANPYIDLGMVGMDMGRNRVNLTPEADGVFRGTGVIVRCPSGRRIWKATVFVPDVGSVEFVFDVVY
ncbi:MAG: hypothetical protein JSU72_20290 [Deltaproteobacteria bacterium]|nr:MAG: hypothetical protein JSU72_20290 [Deltaproteobacteria bacterium]